MSDPFTKLFAQMLAQSQEMARAWNPALEHFDMRALEKMVPIMPADMLEMWFGKTFNREGLDAKTRLLLTIGLSAAALQFAGGTYGYVSTAQTQAQVAAIESAQRTGRPVTAADRLTLGGRGDLSPPSG